MEKKHLNYKKFIDNIDKIVLSDEKKVKSNYEEAERKVYAIIDNIEKLSDETKKWIVNSIFENNGKIDGLAEQLTGTYDVSSETANKIYESIDKKLKKDDFKHMGKVPYGKWEIKPENYTGFNDEQYGTAFQCHYVEQLGLFFVVIDIDAHHSETDIPIATIESCIPEEYRDTRVINTGSGGKHYYFLSKQPPSENFDSEINIDYKTIFKNSVEKIGENTYKNKGKGGYVVASYRWRYDGLEKEKYVHNTSSNQDILIVENTDIIVKAMKANLESKGYIKKETLIVKKDSEEFVKKPLTPPIKEEINEDIINEETGIQLITQEVAKIITKTEGHHNSVLLALEGGLENIGFTQTDRKKILFDALELANDDTSEHKSQIKSSLSKEGEKRGFRFLRRNYENIISEINQIFLLKQKYWPSISKKNYQLIGLHYNELISKLFNKFDKGSYRRRILKYIDAYLNVKGLGLHERFRLIEDINKEYGITDLKNLFEVIKENRIHSLIKNGHMNLDETLYDKLKDNTTKNERRTLDNLVHELDMQLSITQFKSKTPNIQPLTNLVNRPNGLEAYKRRQEASKFLRQNENLKKTENGSYIFDSINTNSYIPIDANKLGNYLTRKYPILELGIEATELENILGLSGEFDELHNEFYLFNNGVLNLHEREFTPTRDFKDYFSIKKMDCKLNLNEKYVDINNSPSCLVDRVLREILIPNYDEDKEDLDYGYYIDFLQRLGSAFNTRIKEKKFACYYGKGDNGKDILIEILKMAFGDRCLLATMDILQDEKADLSEYDVVIIDELDKHSFKDAIAFIKRITGGEEEGTAKRKLYQHDIFKPKNPSAFFLFTNEIPAVPLTDTAFYRREDALELQNRFTENPDDDKANEFRADSSLKDKIKNSKKDSLEWLINAGINAYYGRYDEDGYFKGFTKAQTADGTKMIVSNTDPLSKFLRESYVIDDVKIQTISNKDLVRSYENYCVRENLICDTTSTLSIIMGNAVKNVFGDIKKPASNNTLYYLKAKNQRDNNTQYHIDSNYKWYQKKEEIPEDTYDNYKNVYSRIDELSNQGLVPTKKQLKEEFGHLDIEEILDKLESINLIFKDKR